MRIIVDAFGGDNAPKEIIKGCVDGAKEYKVDISLVGEKSKIINCAKENNFDISNMQIIDAPDIMKMTDTPTEILKSKSNTSMAVGLKALADNNGDAFISAGSTGALLIGGTFIVKRIKGVKRAAIGAVMPSSDKPFFLIDTGANVECSPAMLCQFATLGNIYMNHVLKIQNPKVALANIGVEATKGTPFLVETYQKLSEMKNINFIGNIEVRDIAFGKADVVVADGFTGNVILKMYEGVAKSITNRLKDMFMKNVKTKLSYLGVKSGMNEIKESMNYKKYGGAPIIGLKKVVIKAHGSSDAYAIKNAIRQAKMYSENKVIETIQQELAILGSEITAADEVKG